MDCLKNHRSKIVPIFEIKIMAKFGGIIYQKKIDDKSKDKKKTEPKCTT